MRSKYLLVFTLVLFAAVVLSAESVSIIAQSGTTQEEKAQDMEAEALLEEPAIQAIPATEITLLAEKIKTLLNEIRSAVAPLPEVGKIASGLPEAHRNLEQAKGELEQLVLEDLSTGQLIKLQDEWLRYKQIGDNSQNILVTRSQSLESERAELKQIRETWELTRKVAAERGFADALVELIDSTLAEIETVEQALRQRLDDVFTLQSQVSFQSMAITEVINRIETAREISRQLLFTQDRAPLWQLIFSPGEEPPVWEQIRSMVRERALTLRNFYLDYGQRLLLLVFLFFGVAAILIAVRRSLLSGSQEAAFKPSAYLLTRPFSVSLLISLILSIFILPQMPDAVDKLIAVLGLIPLMRLLPALLDQALRKPIYGLGLIYFLGRLGSLMGDRSLAQRLVLLVVLTLAIGGLIWLLKRDGPLSRLMQGKWAKASALFLRLCLFLFAGAWIANVLGNVALADTLAKGTFWSLYILALLLTGVIVLEDLAFTFLRSRAGQSLRMIRLHTVYWERRITGVLRLAAFAYWAYITLFSFNIFEPLKAGVLKTLRGHLTVGAMSISLGDILAFILTLWISILLARFIRFMLGEEVLPRMTLPRGVPGAVSFTAYYLILVLGFLLALSAAGIEWSRFAILAGALGIGIGFGLQNLVNNFVSGLILIFERPIKVGDTIEFSSLRGQVMRIGIRSSTIRTWEGAEVIVPNGNLISSEVINWTLSDRKRRLKVPVGVAYGTDPNLVLGILTTVAQDHKDVLDDPEPKATLKGFGESSLDFELRYSIREFEDWVWIKSEITLGILDALKTAEIEIPFPQRDLHMRSADAEAGQVSAQLGSGGEDLPVSEEPKEDES
ncbi:mechanosensitive ion channel family protein [Acidobacteriota bacterium]